MAFLTSIILFLSISANALAAESVQPVDICRDSLSKNYASALDELARGYILLEQMRIEGTTPEGTRKASRRAFVQKRLQLIEEIGDLARFEKLFAAALSKLTHKVAQEQNESRQQKRHRLQDEVSTIGIWAQLKIIYASDEAGRIATYSPDRRFIAATAGESVIEILDASNFSVLHTLQLDKAMATRHLEFSPNGETLLVSHGYEVSGFDVKTGAKDEMFYNYRPFVGKFSPDGKTILAISGERMELIKAVHEPKSESRVADISFFTGNNLLRTAFFSPDSQFIVSADSEALMVWNLKGENIARMADGNEYDSNYNWAQFSPDGSKILSTVYSNRSSSPQIWDWKPYADKSFLSRFKKKPKPVAIATKIEKSFDTPYQPTGEILFTAYDKQLYAFDFQSQNLVVVDSSPAKFVSFSADNKLMIAITEDETVRVWDMSKRRLIEDFPAPGAKTAEFGLENKQILLNFADGMIAIYSRQARMDVE